MKNQKVMSQNEYHVVDILGEGATSVVYRAVKKDRSQSLQAEVALKVFSSESHVEVWRREFASLIGVTSPYCVRVFNFEWVMDKPALCLELVEGLTLVELLESQCLRESEVLEVASQALAGLKDLWSFGLCHGDLSPKNIMINESGQVKLLDFGLGNFDETVRRGTPFFTHDSLKQGGAPSQTSDLFSLGRLLNWSGQRLPQSSQSLHELGSEIADNPDSHTPGLEKLKQRPEAKSRLSETVRDRLKRKRAQQPETEEFMVKAQTYQYGQADDAEQTETKKRLMAKARLHRLAIATLVTLTVGVLFFQFRSFQGLEVLETKHLQPATVNIRTQSWKEIWWDGKRKGYTPAKIKDISPGRHVLKWAGPDDSGEIILTLKPGENKLLTDSDLNSQGE